MEKCGRFVLYHNNPNKNLSKAMSDREETLPAGRKDFGPTRKNDKINNDTKKDKQEFKE